MVLWYLLFFFPIFLVTHFLECSIILCLAQKRREGTLGNQGGFS